MKVLEAVVQPVLRRWKGTVLTVPIRCPPKLRLQPLRANDGPQGLKPPSFGSGFGTTKVVPLRRSEEVMQQLLGSKRLVALLLGLVLCHPGASLVQAQQAEVRLAPSLLGEKLVYRLLWPSGVILGEAVFQVASSGEQVQFRLDVEAQVPQYNLRDSFRSTATRVGLCSLQFRQEIKEGTRVWEETIEFDQQNRQARRTRGGQTFIATVPVCAREPLVFLYIIRSQLIEGKLPASGVVHLAADYDVRIEAAGTERVTFRGQSRDAEKYSVTYSSPNREKTFTVWFSTDSARLPLQVRIPFPIGELSAVLE